MDDIIKLLGKLFGIAGGLALIALVLIWFGAVPLVAMIFNAAFTAWHLIVLLTVMMAVIVLIVKYVMK